MYRSLHQIAKRFFSDAQIFKYGFNWSPMYRRSTGKIVSVSEDLMDITVKIPLSYKNRNYVGSIFGGSLFSATDPIFMIQLMNILGDNYIVWDKTASIKFKRPGRETVYANFSFNKHEIKTIKDQVSKNGKYDFIKTTNIVNREKTVIAEIERTIYVADKSFYKNNLKNKQSK